MVIPWVRQWTSSITRWARVHPDACLAPPVLWPPAGRPPVVAKIASPRPISRGSPACTTRPSRCRCAIPADPGRNGGSMNQAIAESLGYCLIPRCAALVWRIAIRCARSANGDDRRSRTGKRVGAGDLPWFVAFTPEAHGASDLATSSKYPGLANPACPRAGSAACSTTAVSWRVPTRTAWTRRSPVMDWAHLAGDISVVDPPSLLQLARWRRRRTIARSCAWCSVQLTPSATAAAGFCGAAPGDHIMRGRTPFAHR